MQVVRGGLRGRGLVKAATTTSTLVPSTSSRASWRRIAGEVVAGTVRVRGSRPGWRPRVDSASDRSMSAFFGGEGE